MALVQAARRSLADRPSRISCVSRLAAVSASLSVAASVTPRAVEVGRRDLLFLGQRLDLRRRAVDQHDADVQRAQHRDVQQDVGEVLVGDDRAVDAEDERLLAELRNVLQDAPQVGRFHVRLRFGFRSGGLRRRFGFGQSRFERLQAALVFLRRADGDADPLRQAGSRPSAAR